MCFFLYTKKKHIIFVFSEWSTGRSVFCGVGYNTSKKKRSTVRRKQQCIFFIYKKKCTVALVLADSKKEEKHCVGYNASFFLLFCALSKNKNIYIFIFAPFGALKGARPAGAGRAPPTSSITAPPAHIMEYTLLCMAETGLILLRRYNLPFTLIYALKSAILALWRLVL